MWKHTLRQRGNCNEANQALSSKHVDKQFDWSKRFPFMENWIAKDHLIVEPYFNAKRELIKKWQLAIHYHHDAFFIHPSIQNLIDEQSFIDLIFWLFKENVKIIEVLNNLGILWPTRAQMHFSSFRGYKYIGVFSMVNSSLDLQENQRIYFQTWA